MHVCIYIYIFFQLYIYKKNLHFFQGYGKNLWLMQGMFRANGGRGYVKKPKFLCDGDLSFRPNEVKKILKVDWKSNKKAAILSCHSHDHILIN